LLSSVRKIYIDFCFLQDTEQQAWLTLLKSALASLGLNPSIESFSGLPPEDGSNFAFITDSAALSRKLLLNIPHIFLQPVRRPVKVDAFFHWWPLADLNQYPPAYPNVTLISSVFRGDVFLGGFLSNMASLDGYADCQHLLIRAGSPGDEHQQLIQHVRRYPCAVYINLSRDPGLYAVWNLGLQLSTGQYVSNANLDDRRASTQLIYLQSVLEQNPKVTVASTPLRVSELKNLSWEDSGKCPVMFANEREQVVGPEQLFRQTPQGLASRNVPHCMPLWRRSVHFFAGEFDERRYGPSADWAFWLKAGYRGARFYIGGEALGLYLRDADSYWRRNSLAGEIDTGIVAEFSDWYGAVGLRPLGLELTRAISLLQAGSVLEGLGRLLMAMANPFPRNTFVQRCTDPVITVQEHRLFESECVLLDLVCQKFFDYPEGTAWAKRFGTTVALGGPMESAFFNALVDLLHLVGNATDVAVKRRLALACVDWMTCFADAKGAIALAFLAGRCGFAESEQKILQRQHSVDAADFWLRIQQVYRFSRPLPELCSLVDALETDWQPVLPWSRYQIFFYPAFTNDYQELLYAPLRAAGGNALGSLEIQDFLAHSPTTIPHVPNFFDTETVFHVHWVNHFFAHSGWTTAQRAEQIEDFFASLSKKKQAGCKVFWTIHNYLSHESVDRAAEAAFRRRLFQLADRVFLHHPLAISLLDWLPAEGRENKLCLCEHGAYDLTMPASVSRSAARIALGYGEDEWVVTHIGQVRDYKGLDRWLPVLFELLVNTPRMRLVIAGKIQSASVRFWLENHRHPRLTVRDAFIDDDLLVKQMRAADIGFLSYKMILTSGSLVHWLSCGRPVLAPPLGTVAAYLVDGWNGFLYKDETDLKQILKTVVKMPAEELARLSRNALDTTQSLHWRMFSN